MHFTSKNRVKVSEHIGSLIDTLRLKFWYSFISVPDQELTDV